jgi:hypothetical protein
MYEYFYLHSENDSCYTKVIPPHKLGFSGPIERKFIDIYRYCPSFATYDRKYFMERNKRYVPFGMDVNLDGKLYLKVLTVEYLMELAEGTPFAKGKDIDGNEWVAVKLGGYGIKWTVFKGVGNFSIDQIMLHGTKVPKSEVLNYIKCNAEVLRKYKV